MEGLPDSVIHLSMSDVVSLCLTVIESLQLDKRMWRTIGGHLTCCLFPPCLAVNGHPLYFSDKGTKNLRNLLTFFIFSSFFLVNSKKVLIFAPS